MEKIIDLEVKDSKSLVIQIDQYLSNLQDYDKPLLIWNTEFKSIFDYCRSIDGLASLNIPFIGHNNAIIDGKVIRIKEHPKLLEKYTYPSSYKEGKTKGFSYFPNSIKQLRESTDYICRTVSEAKIPVVCCIESNPNSDCPDFEKKKFYNVFYNGSIPFIFVDGDIINTFEDWIEWGIMPSKRDNRCTNVLPEIIMYLKEHPEDFYRTPKGVDGFPWIAGPTADPRGWLAFSDTLYINYLDNDFGTKYTDVRSIPKSELFKAGTGIIGEDVAERFAQFVKLKS